MLSFSEDRHRTPTLRRPLSGSSGCDSGQAVWKDRSVAVVVPAYQEGRLIADTLRGVPAFVDHIVVVDDASKDDTARAVGRVADPRIVLLEHPENRGVGAAIASGYVRALELGADILVVMAGDNQMDPADLPRLLAPLCNGEADYVKGNRFLHPDVKCMPWPRRVAGSGLARLTRLASGLSIDDSQCGYTALSKAAAQRIPLSELWPRYGYPNDLLLLLGRVGCAVREVPVRPVYADEKSGVRPWHALVVAAVIARRWVRFRLG